MADEAGLLDLDALAKQAEFETPGDTASAPKTRRPRSDAGVPRGPRGGAAAGRRGTKLAEQLLDPLAKLAQGIAFIAPTVAAVIVSRGEKVTTALVDIAAGHPKMLAALQRVSKTGPASDLIEFGVMLILAGALDFGRIPPEHPLARITGVSQLYAMTHPDLPATEEMGFPGFVSEPPPPAPNNPRHPVYSFQARQGAGAASA